MSYSFLTRSVLLAVSAPFLALAAATGQNVVISEIMYHPAATNLSEQWLELHNLGTNTADLSGWKLSSGVSYAFPTNTTMPAGGYLVVAAVGPVFSGKHPGVTNFVAGWTGGLSHDGEEIVLEDESGNPVNRVAYAPEGDWALRRLGSPDPLKRQGWEWYAEHNGLGKTLELVNSQLPNRNGQNWASSIPSGGTPGAANSVARTNVAPLILDVVHFPVVPRSTDPVAISARALDENTNGLAVTLFWRLDGAAGFSAAPMLDDGRHGDGLAGDGVFGFVLPPHQDGTVIEFYLTAQDAETNLRTYPHVNPFGTARTANLVYQVDSSAYAGRQPVMRFIMARAEYDYLATEVWGGEPFSDALVNGTFINTDGVLDGGTTTQVRYNCGFRNRGHGTRSAVPHNFHVAFPSDRSWKGRNGLNLNTHYPHSQLLGSAIFRRLGMPMADSRAVQVRVNGANLAKSGQEQFGSYAANELVDGRMVKRQFPLDSEGNLYRGIRDMIPGISADADLVWHGPSYTGYTNAYSKENNATANDWSDLIQLIDVLNHSSDAFYASAVSNVANVDEWMKYFAVNTLLDNQENSLGIGSGDDFALYRGTNDTRFQLLPYDMDSLMGRGQRATSYNDGLWRMTNVAAINRFMKRPEFVPLYFKHLKQLASTAFSPAEMDPLVDQLLEGYLDTTAIANMKAFNSNHVAYVLSLVPRALTVAHSLTVQNGYPRSTAAAVALNGYADAAETRTVLVNGQRANWSAWEGKWSLGSVSLAPGINRVLVQALGVGDLEAGRTSLDIWFDDGSVQPVGGNIVVNTTWTTAGGPYQVTSPLTVGSGTTLTIEPGTTVYLAAGANFSVASGGRLLAEGTAAAPIRFTHLPGTTATWGGIVINGGTGSPETRIVRAHIEFNGSTAIHSTAGSVFLDHLTFGTTDKQYLSLDDSSFIVQDCVFPTTTAGFEPVHGTGGIKTGGHGLFLRNYFGSPNGYNDVIDFTGCNRPGPIVHFLGNVFTGASDDMLDLDGTDAWVEGNLFLHAHKNGSPDSSSAISGGNDSGHTSEVTIIGNLFYDCDQAVTAKQGNFYTLLHNTVVHQTKQGGLDTDAGVINLADDGTTEGAGMYLEGNIIVDAEKLVRNWTSAKVTFTNNLLSLPWNGTGGANSAAPPLLTHVPELQETHFSSWAEGQVMWEWLRPQAGSPAIGAGANGWDLGGVVGLGASVAGEPDGITGATSAVLTVGPNRTGSSIPTAGWPAGSGYTHYRWRLEGGDWSGEVPIDSPIHLAGLSQGEHRVEVAGKRDSGLYQDDVLLGSLAVVSASRTWTVDPNYVAPTHPKVRLSEVLARNATTLTNLGTTPDLIELHNYGQEAVDLSGFGLTDRVAEPFKFVLPPGTVLAGGGFLILLADNSTGGPYLHTGFSLKPAGEDLYLYDKAPAGGALLDAVAFGLQVVDLSIGRRTDGMWGLCQPTFGGTNVAAATGDFRSLRINEWLADAQFVAKNDFVELYNPEALPVALSGLLLSDAGGAPHRHPIAALSFIAGGGFAEFVADGDPGQAPDHLSFSLSPDVGLILLSTPDLSPIDAINYGPQRTDVSQGRSPNGGEQWASFTEPTPGGGNPGSSGGDSSVVTTTIPLVPMTATWRYHQTANLDGVTWQAPDYNDSGWTTGPALLGVEDSALPAPGLRTHLTLGRTTYYFRTTFVVDTNLAGFNLNLTTVVDDGVVVYLNGVRILTNGIGNGTPAYATVSSRNVGNATLEYFKATVGALTQGTNVLAAEVHQTSASSSDIVWGMALDASRTSTNHTAGGTLPVVLNEVSAGGPVVDAPGTTSPDYVELFNPSTNSVDLSDCSLTDDAEFGRKWVFPPGTTLKAGAYLAIDCVGAQLPSATNTGFGLAAVGGRVLLFGSPAQGGALIDGVTFGLQTPGFSLGRTPDGAGAWALVVPSLGAANTAAGLASVSALRINEWMAAPSSGGDWFEIYNTAELPVSLGGLFLTDDLTDRTQSPVPPLSFIGTGANAFLRFTADGNQQAGGDHVKFSLNKSGESIGLFSAAGVLIDGVEFGPQQTGVSQGRFPDGTATVAAFPATASPAQSNYLPLDNALINEVLTHTDPPLEDALELSNPTATPANLGGWFLSNSGANLKKFRIPDGTVLPAGGFTVFYESQFNSTNGVPFTFNSAHGGTTILSSSDAAGNLTGYRSEVKFGAGAGGVSFGRYHTSVGVDFTALSARTFGVDNPGTVEQFRTGRGLPNATPKLGPVVISELHYRPAAGTTENADEEYIELENISASPVALYDAAAPTNTWHLRDAVEFEFPPAIVLPAGARMLVVGFDVSNAPMLATFRSRFAVPPTVPVFGPWIGRLANDSDSVELVKPDAVQSAPHPDAGFVPQILVERVHYSALAPWPAIAGTNSLQRVALAAYGNDPVNWKASPPTAGRPNAAAPADSDGDGLPDAWEMTYFGSLARDGAGDFDDDGLTDQQEFLAGTSPADRTDVLRILSVAATGSASITFTAVAGRSYTLQSRDSLGSGDWGRLSDVPPPSATGPVTVVDDSQLTASRFYRVITPAQP